MAELSISERKWGPIIATLYVTDQNTVIVRGLYHDEENNRFYTGPTCEIGKVPPELANIREASPYCFVHNTGWQRFIRDLWKIVQDNPWYYYV